MSSVEVVEEEALHLVEVEVEVEVEGQAPLLVLAKEALSELIPS